MSTVERWSTVEIVALEGWLNVFTVADEFHHVTSCVPTRTP